MWKCKNSPAHNVQIYTLGEVVSIKSTPLSCPSPVGLNVDRRINETKQNKTKQTNKQKNNLNLPTSDDTISRTSISTGSTDLHEMLGSNPKHNACVILLTKAISISNSKVHKYKVRKLKTSFHLATLQIAQLQKPEFAILSLVQLLEE